MNDEIKIKLIVDADSADRAKNLIDGAINCLHALSYEQLNDEIWQAIKLLEKAKGELC